MKTNNKVKINYKAYFLISTIMFIKNISYQKYTLNYPYLLINWIQFIICYSPVHAVVIIHNH